MPTTPLLKRWHARPFHPAVIDALYPWLTDHGSLTARIRARCTTFRVEVLRQRLGRLHPDEADQLGVRRGALGWVREVLLIADGRAVVFARSVLPRANVRGAWHLFHGIGSRPLGAALFADPRIAREPLTSARIDRRDARYDRAIAAAGIAPVRAGLWARRSLFRLRGRALLVTEVFLPAVLDLPA